MSRIFPLKMLIKFERSREPKFKRSLNWSFPKLDDFVK